MFSRSERWGLSGRGWLLLGTTILLGSGLFVTRIYSFLAKTNRVPAKILVVEGWVHDNAVRAAIQEFKTGQYDRVFTTGGPITGSGEGASGPIAADVMGDWLIYRGIPREALQAVPSRAIARDRTYATAADLRNWWHEHQMEVRSFNVISETVHARRTHLLYRKAFGEGVAVGIIAAPNLDYDPKRWWHSSQGVVDVLSETVAYLYAKILFSPPRNDR